MSEEGESNGVEGSCTHQMNHSGDGGVKDPEFAPNSPDFHADLRGNRVVVMESKGEQEQQLLVLQQKEEDVGEGGRIRDEFGLSVDRSVTDEYLTFKSEKLEQLSFEVETKWKEKGITPYNVELLLGNEDSERREEGEETNLSGGDDEKYGSSRGWKMEEMYRLIYEYGVPNSMRGKIWYWLTRAGETEKRSKIAYWSSLVKTKTNVTKAIEKDVTRTFPGHPFFDSPSGQHSLLRLLTAYSVFNPTLGYCQVLFDISFLSSLENCYLQTRSQ